MKENIEKINQSILKKRTREYNLVNGPRVGDFVKQNGKYDRITHDWGDRLQAGGNSGSYYLGNGYLSYSGGLNQGYLKNQLVETGEKKNGRVWFFSENHQKAHNSVHFQIEQRVFQFID